MSKQAEQQQTIAAFYVPDEAAKPTFTATRVVEPADEYHAKTDAISKSMLTTFRKSRREYEAMYVTKTRITPPSAAMEAGTVFHTAALNKMFGLDTAKWKGQRVTLYVRDDVKLMGKRVQGIRIREQAAKGPAIPAKEDNNDNPFEH